MCLEKLSLKSAPVKEYLNIQVGANALKVVKLCSKKQRTAEEISEKSKLTITQVRTVLQRLYSLSLVHCSKAMIERTNWIAYSWLLNLDRLFESVRDAYKTKLSVIENKIEEGENTISFSCSNSCRNHTLERAMELDFRCLSCDSELVQKDNSSNIKKMKAIHCDLLARTA